MPNAGPPVRPIFKSIRQVTSSGEKTRRKVSSATRIFHGEFRRVYLRPTIQRVDSSSLSGARLESMLSDSFAVGPLLGKIAHSVHPQGLLQIFWPNIPISWTACRRTAEKDRIPYAVDPWATSPEKS